MPVQAIMALVLAVVLVSLAVAPSILVGVARVAAHVHHGQDIVAEVLFPSWPVESRPQRGHGLVRGCKATGRAGFRVKVDDARQIQAPAPTMLRTGVATAGAG